MRRKDRKNNTSRKSYHVCWAVTVKKSNRINMVLVSGSKDEIRRFVFDKLMEQVKFVQTWHKNYVVNEAESTLNIEDVKEERFPDVKSVEGKAVFTTKKGSTQKACILVRAVPEDQTQAFFFSDDPYKEE